MRRFHIDTMVPLNKTACWAANKDALAIKASIEGPMYPPGQANELCA